MKKRTVTPKKETVKRMVLRSANKKEKFPSMTDAANDESSFDSVPPFSYPESSEPIINSFAEDRPADVDFTNECNSSDLDSVFGPDTVSDNAPVKYSVPVVPVVVASTATVFVAIIAVYYTFFYQITP